MNPMIEYVKLIKSPNAAWTALLGASVWLYLCYYSFFGSEFDTEAKAVLMLASISASFVLVHSTEKLFRFLTGIFSSASARLISKMQALKHHREIKIGIVKKLKSLDKDEINFLNLFYSKGMPVGSKESKKMMRPELFSAGIRLAKSGVLFHVEKNESELFQIPRRLKGKMAQLNGVPVRDSIRLNTNFIIASYANGGGALPYITRPYAQTSRLRA